MIRRAKGSTVSRRGIPGAIASVYVLAGGLWILLSGPVVGLLTGARHPITRVEALKDGMFVGLTGLLLYVLLRRYVSFLETSREAIARSRNFHLPAFEGLRIPVWRSTADGSWDFVNRSWLALTGRDADAELGWGWRTGILEEDRGEATERYMASIGERRPFAFEFRVLTASGRIRWIMHYGAPFTDAEGNYAGHIGFCQDTTDRRLLEAEAQRTRTLETIGTLAGGIAHDFNNLLTAVMGNISLAMLLAGRDGRGDIVSRLEEAENACVRGQSLTRELLTFSDGGSPVRRPASLQQLIRRAVHAASGSGHEGFVFHLDDDLFPLEIDEAQIQQVVENVVRNAREATGRGGVVHVGAGNITVAEEDAHTLRAGDYVRIAIVDRGVGIPEENLPRIFDPFFTTKEKGTGLGLAISHSIVKRHEGYITAQSRTGAGSTFHIYLPSSAKGHPRKAVPGRLETPEGRKKILLMDAEAMVRQVVRRMVEQLGHFVTDVGDGREAVEVYREAKDAGCPYDAVILGLTVPGGQGAEECIRQLRRIDPGVRAVVTSGYVNDTVMREYARFGFLGAIGKPYDIRGIEVALAPLLYGRSSLPGAHSLENCENNFTEKEGESPQE